MSASQRDPTERRPPSLAFVAAASVFVAGAVIALAFVVGALVFRGPEPSEAPPPSTPPHTEPAEAQPAAPGAVRELRGPPFQAGQQWEGSLECPARQMTMDVRLSVHARSAAVLRVHLRVRGPSVLAEWRAEGADEAPHYRLASTGEVAERPPEWFGMPTFDGSLDASGRRYAGVTVGGPCGAFVLHRVE